MGFSVVVGGRHPWHCTMVKCFKLFEMSNWKKNNNILTQSVLLLPDWEPWIFQSTPSLTSLCAQCAGGGRVIGSISSNRVTQDSQTSCTSVSIAEIICLLSKNPITKIWHCLPPRYFMRFPEALLHIISAKSVAQALLQIVYWVSIPKEILTDPQHIVHVLHIKRTVQITGHWICSDHCLPPSDWRAGWAAE